MTDSPSTPPKKHRVKRYAGKVRDHLDAPEDGITKKTKRAVPNKDRKIGRPNQRIRSVVEEIANGMTYRQAAEKVGIPISPCGNPTPVSTMMERPYVRDMISEVRAETARDHKITRKMVLEGMQEAIDMARTIAEPAIMIAGWREIGKMCGFYEAVKVKVDLTSGGATLTTKLMTMSDEDLLRIAEGQMTDSDGEILEGQFTRDPN